MSAATIGFAWSTCVFFGLWVYALFGTRRVGERHLWAIRYALDEVHGVWNSRNFLRCYVDGRHDIIERDFPDFADFCRQMDADQ